MRQVKLAPEVPIERRKTGLDALPINRRKNEGQSRLPILSLPAEWLNETD